MFDVAGKRRVVFTDHAIQRWQTRVFPRFDKAVAERTVSQARVATKRERRRWHDVKSHRRQATRADRLSFLVNDDLHVVLCVAWSHDAVIIKTVWRIGDRPTDEE